MSEEQQLREAVRQRYAEAAIAVTSGQPGARCCASSEADLSCCSPTPAAAFEAQADLPDAFGSGLYGAAETSDLPAEAVLASLGCGNPVAVADLRSGERVLDLGSGGGLDVLLSAQRVGPTGWAYGLDMTPEMLHLARANAAEAGVQNVEFLEGAIEQIPLPAGAVDVVISNCVINLSTDKPRVLAEMFRVLKPGGRAGVSDVVAADDVTVAERAERGSYVGCIAGPLSRSEYLDRLSDVGFVDASVEFTHEVAAGLYGAIIRAAKPHSS
jgi:arsenite methyltransferase